MSSLGERVKKTRKENTDNLRKGVLEAVLKIYNAKELAKQDVCPLCGCVIGEYTWTVTNFEKDLKPIGLSGVQCSNSSCLLHNGIVYEEECKRLAEWQRGNIKNPVIRGLDEEKDPNRFKWQLAKDKKKIREAVKGMAERMEFSDSSTWPVGEKGKTASMKFEIVMVFDYSDYHGGSTIHQELFKTIEEMDYKIFYVFTEWQNKKVKIMIEKEVAV